MVFLQKYFKKIDFEKSHQTKFSIKLVLIIYSLHSSDYFIQLIFANNLNPDQARHNVGLDLDPNCLTLMVLLKDLKKIADDKKGFKTTQHAKSKAINH